MNPLALVALVLSARAFEAKTLPDIDIWSC
jgi:hypothetical protein